MINQWVSDCQFWDIIILYIYIYIYNYIIYIHKCVCYKDMRSTLIDMT